MLPSLRYPTPPGGLSDAVEAMTPDLASLEAKAQAATPRGNLLDETPMMLPYTNAGVSYGSADHQFIAACNPQTILALVARVRELASQLWLEHTSAVHKCIDGEKLGIPCYTRELVRPVLTPSEPRDG